LETENGRKAVMKIGNREFRTSGHTYVMGILNVTPDSFSDGGKWNQRDRALAHVEEMLKEGADVIDIGGESTRPGYTLLSEEEEAARVVPVVEAVKAAFDVPISLDTYKSQVAQAGIAAGADLINDIWGLKYDGTMAKVIGDSGLPCCLMHNRRQTDYENFIRDVVVDLAETLGLAEEAGISREKIILDPGVGFAKDYGQNLEVIRNLEELNRLGCPLLLGCSRKSVVGLTLDLPVDQRLEGTLATTVLGVVKGCMFVRVHDVKENVRAIKMTEAILGGGRGDVY
jgi:dihydropteroate synthase